MARKNVGFTIDTKLSEELKKRAKDQNLSVSRFVENILKKELKI